MSSLLYLWVQRVFFLCLVFYCFDGFAQDFSRLDIPISANDQILQNSLAGGLISPIFNQIDLDNDGDQDLIVFDKVGNVLLPFVNEGATGETNYTFAPEYIENFPKIEVWMLLRDYDGDGIEDLFKFPSLPGIPGIEVQKGKRDANGLSFDLVEFPDKQFDILFIPIGNGDTQIYVANTDVPEVVDIDADGDLDILSFEVNGGTIFYYKNLSVEQGFGRDSLIYVLADDCYGKMQENGFDSSINISADGINCASFFNEEDPYLEVRHAGSTICAIDEDNNGLVDLLVGDISNRNLILMRDNGSAESAWFNDVDLSYPSENVPAEINVFLTAAHLDIDNDGKKDLLVAGNLTNPIQADAHIWFYKNVSVDDSPIFDLTTENFLVDQMIFAGAEANVSLADINQDGLMDMIIGSRGKINTDGNPQSRLTYFRNTGTSTNPSFSLQDDDYLGMSQFSNTSASYYPGFGDLDSDGDIDLLVGDNVGYFYWFENTAGANNQFAFAAPVYKYQDIRYGQEAKPFLMDINEDGLTDLLIGERNFNSDNGVIGSINYLQNQGGIGSPLFNAIDQMPNSQTFGGVNTRDLRFINNFSSPYLVDTGSDFNLLVGTESGDIFRYDQIKNNIDGTFVKQDSVWGKINEGMRTSIAVYDIDDDGFFEMLVGNRRGGVAWYNTTLRLDGSTANEEITDIDISPIKLAPNPSTGIFNLSKAPITAPYQIYDLTGKSILQGRLTSDQLDLSDLADGVYLMKLHLSDQVKTEKLVVAR